MAHVVPFNLEDWWCSSEFNVPQDIHMCAYADLLVVVSSTNPLLFVIVTVGADVGVP